jgi:hypothetical protein
MLCIVAQKFGQPAVNIEVHVGASNVQQYALQVVEVQADGDELDQIHSWGLPNTRARVQRYYGSMARFIVGNWK